MQNILNQMNEWWKNQPIDAKINRPKYLKIFKENADNKEILLLMGSRRVGKTTIMKQWINFLLKNNKIKPQQILYVLLDHPELKKYSLIQILDTYLKMHGLSTKEPIYVFFDEIQYRKNWDQEIKAIYEIYKIKLILSGSSISLLSRQKNYLTGRYLKYIVNPLDMQTMSEKIIDLFKKPDKAEQFGLAGYNRVKQKFSLKKQVEKYLEEFKL